MSRLIGAKRRAVLKVHEVTGLSTLVVIDPERRGSAKVVHPPVKLVDPAGNEVKIPGTTSR